MNKAQDTFISSTMWTDRAGFVASIETLKFMKKNNVQKKLIKIGKCIKHIWETEANKIGLNIKITGQESMPYLTFDYPNNLEISTFFTQEMLKKGFLASNLASVSISHNLKIIKKYQFALSNVFKKINLIIKTNKKFPLMGPIKHSTFRRLT